MDPITVIQLLASLFTLLKVCRTSLETIEEFRQGDDDLAELTRDLETFVAFLQGLETLLSHQKERKLPQSSLFEDIQKALHDAQKTVQKLTRQLNRVKKSNSLVARRLKWLQYHAELQKLQGRIRDHNASLTAFVVLICAQGFMLECSQEPQLLQFCTRVQEEEGAVDLVMDLPTEDGASMIIARLEPSLSSTALDVSALSGPSSEIIIHGPDKLPGVGARRKSCAFDCYCDCHSGDGDETARLQLKSKISVFSTLTRSSRRCSEPTCQRALRIRAKKLVFPSFNFSKALVSLVGARGWTVKHHLNTYRLVPETSDSMRYARHGALASLKACIEAGEAAPFDTAPDGWSLLHVGKFSEKLAACSLWDVWTSSYGGQLEIVKYLLSLGADTEVGEVGCRKPADFAILRALAIDSNDVQKQIVRAFPAFDTYMNDFGFSPIHIAVLDLYEPTDTLQPSLQDLIDFVDDANNSNPGNDWSIWRRSEARASPLYADIIEKFRNAALKLPKMHKTILNLIDEPDEKWGWPPFHWAAFTGRRGKMEVLLENNADPFIISPMKRNSLHIAAESKRPEVLSYVLDIWAENKEKMEINKADRWMESPLHVASAGSSACVQLLLNSGADPNAKQNNQQTPLHYACICASEEEKLRVISLLCGAKDISINHQDEDGRTAVFQYLDSCACIQALADFGVDLSLADNTGHTVIHCACIDDEPEALAMLLNLTSDPGAVARHTEKGHTPLLEACIHKSKECILLLLKRPGPGVKCSEVGKEGWAALHYAAELGDEEILEAVLTHPSFKRGQKTSDGKSAELIAKEACMWQGRCKELLKKYDSVAGNIKHSDDAAIRERAVFRESAAFYLSMR